MGVLQDNLSAIELEMAYTSWHGSCQDPLLPEPYDERACRRAKGHEGYHAAGFSANGSLILWATVTGNITQSEGHTG